MQFVVPLNWSLRIINPASQTTIWIEPSCLLHAAESRRAQSKRFPFLDPGALLCPAGSTQAIAQGLLHQNRNVPARVINCMSRPVMPINLTLQITVFQNSCRSSSRTSSRCLNAKKAVGSYLAVCGHPWLDHWKHIVRSTEVGIPFYCARSLSQWTCRFDWKVFGGQSSEIGEWDGAQKSCWWTWKVSSFSRLARLREDNVHAFVPFGLYRPFTSLSATDIVRLAIITRLEMTRPYIKRWPEALAIMAHPTNSIMSFTQLGKLVDDIWFYAGDKSPDVRNWFL